MSVRVFGLDLADPKTTREIVVTNAVSKAIVMGCGACFSVISTRMIIEHFGVAAYAQYGLLVSIAMLMPFADLGLGAAIMNTVASASSPSSPAIGRVLISALRVLVCSATAVIAAAALITATGWWPLLLGDGLLPGGGIAAFCCALIFALRLPFGIGQRLLTGLGLNHVQIRLQFVQAPLFLTSILLLVSLNAPGNLLAPVSYGGALIVAVGSVWIARRHVHPNVGWALTRLPRWKSVRGARTMHVAWPMLVQLAVLPLAFQTDRILLSHLGTTEDLAEYNLAAQMFGMILQSITAAGIALWPIFARARSKAEIRSPFRLAVAFGGGALALASVLAAVLPWAAPIISHGRIELGVWILVGFAIFMALQGLKYPLGMYMTDAHGLRFQVIPILVLVPLNVVVSWVLIDPLGAAGPVIGSAISVALCQVIPNIWYVGKDVARRRAHTLEPLRPV